MKLLTPERTCQHCGEQFPVPRRPGRPPSFCSSTCRRAAQRAYKRDYARDGRAVEDLPPVELADWAITPIEADAIARAATGDEDASMWSAFVPDRWTTLSHDDHPDVEPGAYVGTTSPDVGPVIGSDRPWWDAE
ncbi:hypothetical protein ACWDTQ_04100 [Streptomyces cellulosae]|uniref:hypothetical protein n=1 Tax=Streptomyces sp. enrichment culture TaxID=1795815 RepID=UPI003F550941